MSASSPSQDLPRLRQAVVGVDQEVPLLDGSRQPYVYLDNAASTPAFQAVQEKVNEFLLWYSSVHRGAGFKSLLATEAYEEARQVVLEFVGADPDAYCAIFVKNTTEALNKLANRLNFGPDDVVLTTLMEHHSNDLPWRAKARVVYAGLREDGSLDVEDLAQELERYKGRVRVVTVTGASNVTGFTPPIYDIAEMAHQYGAYMVVDCAQLAPHRAVRMGDPASPRRLDFVAFSAHKMYAPFGTGVLVGPREVFRNGPPDYRGGGTIEIVNLGEVHWAEPPERDEAGSPNVVGAVALAASIRVLSQVGMEALEAHERELTRYALQRLRTLEGVRVYGSNDPEKLDGRLGVIAFEVNGVPHGKVAAILGFEGGIGVRNGCFCAHPYVLRLLGISKSAYERYKDQALQGDRSALPGLVRASFGCYNTREEVDRLVEMLDRIVHGEYAGQYEVDRPTGMYLPQGFDEARLRAHFAL